MTQKNNVLAHSTIGKITASLVLFIALSLGIYWFFADRHVYTDAVVAPSTVKGDWFGSAIGVGEHWAIVSAFRESGTAEQAGAAYLYKLDGASQWLFNQKITGSDAQPFDQFGFSVSLDEDVLAVGSVSTFAVEPLSRSDGRVYVFRRNANDEWLEEAVLTAPDAGLNDRFGYSVALSGGWLVVGAKHSGADGNNAGAAYLFHYQDNQWVFQQRLRPDSLQNGDEFGTDVDISSTQGTLVVGAPGVDVGGKSDSGEIYLYKLLDNQWSLKGALKILDQPIESHQLGVGIEISATNDWILAGASSWKREPRTGAAYVIGLAKEGDLSVPEFVTPLVPDAVAVGDMLGFRVDWAGNTALVSAHLADSEVQDTGAVFSFSYESGDWSSGTPFIAADRHKNDYYGIALAGHESSELGKQIIIGAETADVKGKDSGAIYFYPLGER